MIYISILILFRYQVHTSAKVNSWIETQPRMSVFSSWPPASGDLMPIESVWVDILKEFNEREIRVHTEKALWEEIEITFMALTEKEEYVKNLISKISLRLESIKLKKGVLLQ